jgi:hypothetical protein
MVIQQFVSTQGIRFLVNGRELEAKGKKNN